MLFFWVFTIGFFLLDFFSKQWAVATLSTVGSLEVIPALLHLELAYNHGMALGILSGQSLALLVLPVTVVAIGGLVLRRYHLTRFTWIASSLIVSGFLGNFLERLLNGYVVDMIYFPFLPFFICNVADIAITAGVVLFSFSLLFRPNDWREKHAKDSQSRNPE